MTIKELRTKLESMPDEMPVYLLHNEDDRDLKEAREADELTIALATYVPASAFAAPRERGGPQNVGELKFNEERVKALVLR